jgi:hypothetical protein
LGIQYREILAKEGVKLRLLPTSAVWKICDIYATRSRG